jgi:thymidylate synthase (FAD)
MSMNLHTANLIWATPNAEALIVEMARVSSPSPKPFDEGGARLLAYLVEHQHWSPFEMANLCLQIKTTRSIAAQILRHRSFSFQEFSQRYSEPEPMDFWSLQLRPQSVKNRQSSEHDPDFVVNPYLYRKLQKVMEDTHQLYDDLIEVGVARECAREILPLGTPTNLYMNGTLRSWIHYIQLRTKPDTQLEHRMVALSVAGVFSQQFPIISEVVS